MALAVWLVLVAGCDSGGSGASPFRNLGKRGDSALPASVSRPATR
jgi:hypothetical protein